ncbi:hypothetical protein FBU30_008755 [Linnemannia zychae]|nr:hypothetical protein FBU30_008755 [Linnemannia zychae]
MKSHTLQRPHSLAKQGHLQFPTEVLCLVLSYLPRHALVAASRVCKAWSLPASHELWRNIENLKFKNSFLQLVPKYGYLTQRLDIDLDNNNCNVYEPSNPLVYTLQSMPRLQHLSLNFEFASLRAAKLVFTIIKNHTGGNLRSLTLKESPHDILASEEAKAFFSSSSQLTRFEMDEIAKGDLSDILTLLPSLTALAFTDNVQYSRRQRRDRMGFGDEGLRSIGIFLPRLKELAIHFSRIITRMGLEGFSKSCPTLTRIDLRGCQEITSEGLFTFLQAQPHLTHVCLGDTLLDDTGLSVLAATPRSAQLRQLDIQKCKSVLTLGVCQVVEACINLQELNLWGCSRVTLQIFEAPWLCLSLRQLSLGSIHTRPYDEGSYSNPSICKKWLDQMYGRLGELTLLNHLTLLPLPFDIEIFELGRTSLEKMSQLQHLSVVDERHDLRDRDVIWLMTKLPSLRTLDLNLRKRDTPLLRDLCEINPSLKVNFMRNFRLFGSQADGILDSDYDPNSDLDDISAESEDDGSHYSSSQDLYNFNYGYGYNPDSQSEGSDDREGSDASDSVDEKYSRYILNCARNNYHSGISYSEALIHGMIGDGNSDISQDNSEQDYELDSDDGRSDDSDSDRIQGYRSGYRSDRSEILSRLKPNVNGSGNGDDLESFSDREERYHSSDAGSNADGDGSYSDRDIEGEGEYFSDEQQSDGDGEGIYPDSYDDDNSEEQYQDQYESLDDDGGEDQNDELCETYDSSDNGDQYDEDDDEVGNDSGEYSSDNY